MEIAWANSSDFILASSAKNNSAEKRKIFEISKPIVTQDAVRRLVVESFQVFNDLQSIHDRETQADANTLSQISTRYRSIIRCCIINLKDNGADESKIMMYRDIELVWTLCEVLLMGSGCGVVVDLVSWALLNDFANASELLQELASSDPSTVDTHPHYWNSLYAMLLCGNLKGAREILAMHRRKNENSFTSLDELIRKMPLHDAFVSDHQWNFWREECRRRIREGNFALNRNLENAAKILSGDEKIFEEFNFLIPNWYESLVAHLLYQKPTVSIAELRDFVTALEPSNPSRIDKILMATFEFNILELIEGIAETFPDAWWFAVHLADLIHHCGSKDFDVVKHEVDLREYMMLEYGASLMSDKIFWQIGAKYLLRCQRFGKQYLEILLPRLPLKTDREVLKVLDFCKLNDLSGLNFEICRQRSLRAMKEKNQLTLALPWCIQAKDSQLINALSYRYLSEIEKMNSISSWSLFDHLGENLLLNPALAFLAKYREFCRLFETGALKEAAKLLISLIRYDAAPKQCIWLLLQNAIPMMKSDGSLKQEPLVFGAEETFALMDALESLIVHAGISKDGFEINERKLQQIRTLLMSNLTQTLIESS